jgi:hypothetical protein
LLWQQSWSRLEKMKTFAKTATRTRHAVKPIRPSLFRMNPFMTGVIYQKKIFGKRTGRGCRNFEFKLRYQKSLLTISETEIPG